MARFLPNPNSAILLKDFPSVEAAAAYIRYENKLFKLRIIGFFMLYVTLSVLTPI